MLSQWAVDLVVPSLRNGRHVQNVVVRPSIPIRMAQIAKARELLPFLNSDTYTTCSHQLLEECNQASWYSHPSHSTPFHVVCYAETKR